MNSFKPFSYYPDVLVQRTRKEKTETQVLIIVVHSIKESDLELLCPNCRTKHKPDSNWIPEFWKEVHYRTLLCQCGYKISIRTNGFHSGHY